MAYWYQIGLRRAPLLTQSLTTSLLFATGDVVAQQLVERKSLEDHNLARTSRMLLYGGTVFGPAAVTWYKFLSRTVRASNQTAQTLARVACDQAIFAPTLTAVFLTSMSLLEGKNPAEKLSDSYFHALKANYVVWPALQCINFGFVPLQHQVLVVNMASIGWNAFLSVTNSSLTYANDGGKDSGEVLQQVQVV